MRGATVCSGMGAPEVAMPDVEWVFASEIEAAPSAVHAHHFPHVPNWGDMTKFKDWPDADIDLLVGGTPCQSFSVAGLRKGLADPRGNLALTFLAIAAKYSPRWILWENVPGVLSSDRGRDFGAFLGGLGQCGYGWAYRVLDAQYFGVPQRRRRVFVVGHLGDWRRAAAVLFERHSLQGHPPPRREERQRAPGGAVAGTDCRLYQDSEFGVGEYDSAGSLRAGRIPEHQMVIAHSLRGEGFDAIEDGTGRGTPIVPVGVTIHGTDGTATAASFTDIAGSLRTKAPGSIENSSTTAVMAFAQNSRDELREMPYVGALAAEPGMKQTSYIRQASAVRRLTPRECERLQGFPDDFTLVPYRGGMMKDGPRYKMLGNSMAVPVIAWIDQRIALVDALETIAEAA